MHAHSTTSLSMSGYLPEISESIIIKYILVTRSPCHTDRLQIPWVKIAAHMLIPCPREFVKIGFNPKPLYRLLSHCGRPSWQLPLWHRRKIKATYFIVHFINVGKKYHLHLHYQNAECPLSNSCLCPCNLFDCDDCPILASSHVETCPYYCQMKFYDNRNNLPSQPVMKKGIH